MLLGIDGKEFKVSDTENHECIVLLRRNLQAKSFDKVVRILDNPIEIAIKNKTSDKLVYTRAGILVGYSSVAPHVDVEYLWDTLSKVLINKTTSDIWSPEEGKLVLRTIGAMVLWRISIREENWRVSFMDSGRYDAVTGNEIRIAQYWVEKQHTIYDLKNRFNYVGEVA